MSSAGQGNPEPVLGPADPGLDRPHRPAQAGRGLLVGQTIEEAEHQGSPVLLRQVAHLLADRRDEVRPIRLGDEIELPTRRLPLLRATDGRRPSGARGDPPGDPVQPARRRFMPADRPGLAGEDQERGLEGILRVVLVAEPGAAGPQDHRAMPLDECGEGNLGRFLVAPTVKEPVQQLTVRHPGDRPHLEQQPDWPQDGFTSRRLHESCPLRSVRKPPSSL